MAKIPFYPRILGQFFRNFLKDWTLPVTNMPTSSIIVTTWGNPSRWEEVEYRIKDTHVCSKTTLMPLLQHFYSQNYDVTHLIIIVLDTLASLLGNKPRDYADLKSMVERFILSKLSEFKDISKPTVELPTNTRIIVAPGFGSYSSKPYPYRFKGSMSDYYVYTYAEIFNAARKSMDMGGENLLALDLSHGINFMPSLTYRAVRDILEALHIKTECKLVLFNSDPHFRGVKKIEIHRFEDHLTHHISFRMARNMFRNNIQLKLKTFFNYKNLTPPEIETLEKKLRQYDSGALRNTLLSLSGYRGPLPLALLHYRHEALNPVNTLEEALPNLLIEIMDRNVHIHISDSEITVERRLHAKQQAVEIHKAVTWARQILELTPQIQEPTLKDIYKLAGRLYKGKGLRHLYIHNELARFTRKIYEALIKKPLETHNYISIPALTQQEEKTPDKRNFFAHCGLELNMVEVKITEPEQFIRKAARGKLTEAYSHIKVRYRGKHLKSLETYMIG